MKEEFAMLAHTYSGGNPVGMMASRKLNGWGCIWDGGITRSLYGEEIPWYYLGGDARLKEKPVSTGLWSIGRADKNGPRPKIINAPDWFLNQLPYGVPLQGELWMDDDLQFIKQVCGRGVSGCSDPRWHSVEYRVYNSKPYKLWKGIEAFTDAVQSDFYPNRIWSKRMDMVSQILLHPSIDRENVYVEPQTKISDPVELERFYQFCVDSGFEGAMLANPNAYYSCSRSWDLLKYKPKFDAEATVVGYEDGKTGKNIGRLGAVVGLITWGEDVLSFTGGQEWHIGRTVKFGISGWTDEEREWDCIRNIQPLGSEVPFTFLSISNDGVPCSCNVRRS